MSTWEEHYDSVRKQVKPTITWWMLQRKMICECCGKTLVLCGPCDQKYICTAAQDYSIRACICQRCYRLPINEFNEMRARNYDTVLRNLETLTRKRRGPSVTPQSDTTIE